MKCEKDCARVEEKKQLCGTVREESIMSYARWIQAEIMLMASMPI